MSFRERLRHVTRKVFMPAHQAGGKVLLTEMDMQEPEIEGREIKLLVRLRDLKRWSSLSSPLFVTFES